MAGSRFSAQKLAAIAAATIVVAVVEQAATLIRDPDLGAPGPLDVLLLLGIHLVPVTIASAIGWVLAAIRGRGRTIVADLAGAALGALGWWWAARVLLSGPFIAAQPYTPWLYPAGALVGAGVGGGFARLVGPPGVRTPRRAIAIAAAIVGLGAADAWIEPGQHPAFHLLVYGHVVVLAWALVVGTLGELARLERTRWISLAAAVAVGAAAWAGGPDARARLLLRSPIATELLRAAALSEPTWLARTLAHPTVAPEDEPRWRAPETAPCAGCSVVLVTIDALRADALPPLRSASTRFAELRTPFLDRWLEQAVLFTRAYAPASYTMASLPAIFAGGDRGSPSRLPRAMARSGLEPLAVIERYFVEEEYGRALLADFSRVTVHERSETSRAVDRLLAAIDRGGPGPVFAWLHLIALHAPGHAARELGPRDGDWNTRYRRALGWVDGEIGRLYRGLEARGRLDRTLVVLTSDHGEGLGDNGIELHGESVLEEEVRVPLALWIPGRAPARIERTVGIVELLPTLVHLLGSADRVALDPRASGLMPLLDDPAHAWERGYVLRSRRGHLAWVHGTDKLILDRKADVALRFDLALDPGEVVDRFGLDAERGRAAIAALVRAAPGEFGDELGQRGTRASLRERLADGGAAPDRFLLELAAIATDPEIVRQVETLASGDLDDATRVELARGFGTRPELAIGRDLVAELGRRAGTAAELELLVRLAAEAVPPPDPAALAAVAAAAIATGTPAVATAWMAWMESWAEVPTELGEVIQALLPASFELVGRLSAAPAEPIRTALLAEVEAGLSAAEPRTRLAALRAAAVIGTTATALQVAAIAPELDDVRLRQAALHVLAVLDSAAAIDPLVAALADPFLAFFALREIQQLGAQAALPAVREAARDHPIARIRALAVQVAASLERGSPEP